MIRTIQIILLVGFVVFYVIGNQIVQSESIVCGDEVDTAIRFAVRLRINVGAGGESRREAADQAVVAPHESPRVIAEVSVPFRPTMPDERPHLIQSGGVPRFGNNFCSR